MTLRNLQIEYSKKAVDYVLEKQPDSEERMQILDWLLDKWKEQSMRLRKGEEVTNPIFEDNFFDVTNSEANVFKHGDFEAAFRGDGNLWIYFNNGGILIRKENQKELLNFLITNL